MTQFIKRNIQEIANSSALAIFGGFLSLTHIFTFLYWTRSEFILKFVSNEDPNPLCWPYFYNCADYRIDLTVIKVIVFVYLLFAMASAIMFFTRRYISIAYSVFALACAIKIFIYLQSYRMMGNYHYMFFIVAALFLWAPKKKDVLRLMIVGFYLSAATLKFNNEWLSGSALYGEPFIQGKWLSWACGYVVVLELFFSLFLLSSRRSFFYFAVVQFLIFHLFSWHIVGFFYPCIMLSFLSIFILCFKTSPLSFRTTRPSSYAILLIFFSAQMVPYFYRGDTALTGEGRFWALNMFDVKSECEFKAFAKFTGRTEDLSWSGAGLGPRIKCDPISYVSFTKNLCSVLADHDDFLGLDVYLASKRTSSVNFTKIFDRQDVCKQNWKFSLFQANSWILKSSNSEQENQNSSWTSPTVNFSIKENIVSHISKPKSQYRENAAANGVSVYEFPCQKLKLLWETSPLNIGVHTASKSSPAVDESGIYVGSDMGWFFAYNHDGTLKWKFYVGEGYGGIHGTAALDNDSVYVGTYDGVLYSLSKDLGKIRWFNKLGISIGASPVLFANDIIVSVELNQDGYLARLNSRDGSLIWQSEKYGDQGHSSPTININDGLVYTGANNGRFFAFDLNDGHFRWGYQAKDSIKGTSALINSKLFFTSWDKTLYALDAKNGHVVWYRDLAEKSQSSVTFTPNLDLIIYGINRKGFAASDIETGKTLWTIPFLGRNHQSSALVTLVSGQPTAWLPCEEKTLCAIAPATGHVRMRFPLSAHFSSVPVAYNNSLYLALDPPGGLVKLHCEP